MAYPTPDEAEIAFYTAFEQRDLATMNRVWAEHPSTACVHPMTIPLTGTAIAAGWRSIFDAAAHFRLSIEPVQQQDMGDVVVHIVKEHLTIGDETTPRPPILATNIYRRDADGWRLWLHHASPVQVGNSDEAQVLH